MQVRLLAICPVITLLLVADQLLAEHKSLPW
jgi:hypothetical protein